MSASTADSDTAITEQLLSLLSLLEVKSSRCNVADENRVMVIVWAKHCHCSRSVRSLNGTALADLMSCLLKIRDPVEWATCIGPYIPTKTSTKSEEAAFCKRVTESAVVLIEKNPEAVANESFNVKYVTNNPSSAKARVLLLILATLAGEAKVARSGVDFSEFSEEIFEAEAENLKNGISADAAKQDSIIKWLEARLETAQKRNSELREQLVSQLGGSSLSELEASLEKDIEQYRDLAGKLASYAERYPMLRGSLVDDVLEKKHRLNWDPSLDLVEALKTAKQRVDALRQGQHQLPSEECSQLLTALAAIESDMKEHIAELETRRVAGSAETVRNLGDSNVIARTEPTHSTPSFDVRKYLIDVNVGAMLPSVSDDTTSHRNDDQ